MLLKSLYAEVRATEFPNDALLTRYRTPAGYVDCFVVDVPGRVSLGRFVQYFYTTPVFRIERTLIRLASDLPSKDLHAEQLALGLRDTYSAWRVEDRTEDQLLMRDIGGRTRSWFMVAHDGEEATLLYFGSAVLPLADTPAARRDGRRIGLMFESSLGFHRLYSRILLSQAARQITKVL